VCHQAELVLDRSPTSPGRARRFVDGELAGCLSVVPDPDPVARVRFDVEVIVSELLTNAIQAAAGAIAVGVWVHRDHVAVGVRDDAPGLPRLQPQDPASSHGRGLAIVAGLAQEWGVNFDRAAAGKLVWARVALPDGVTGELACTYRRGMAVAASRDARARQMGREMRMAAEPGYPSKGSGVEPDEAGPAEGEVFLRVPADTAHVAMVRGLAAHVAARADWPLDDVEDLRLAVDEACAVLLESGAGGSLTARFLDDDDSGLVIELGVDAAPEAAVDTSTVTWLVLVSLVPEIAVSHGDGQLRLVLRARPGAGADS
jgi:serine/threonine-protein kinase RsbW